MVTIRFSILELCLISILVSPIVLPLCAASSVPSVWCPPQRCSCPNAWPSPPFPPMLLAPRGEPGRGAATFLRTSNEVGLLSLFFLSRFGFPPILIEAFWSNHKEDEGKNVVSWRCQIESFSIVRFASCIVLFLCAGLVRTLADRLLFGEFVCRIWPDH
jgi:hypothetical protein